MNGSEDSAFARSDVSLSCFMIGGWPFTQLACISSNRVCSPTAKQSRSGGAATGDVPVDNNVNLMVRVFVASPDFTTF